jgi:hypothetical protein
VLSKTIAVAIQHATTQLGLIFVLATAVSMALDIIAQVMIVKREKTKCESGTVNTW